MDPFTYDKFGRWVYPIGPAPEGWQRREHCSQVIPHTEAGPGDEWQNDDMNLDHYDNLHFIVWLHYGIRGVYGVFGTLDEAVQAAAAWVRSGLDPQSEWDNNITIEAFAGTVWVKVPDHWRDAYFFEGE